MNIIKHILCIFTLFYASATYSQVDIKVDVSGFDSEFLILANYFGDKQVIADTLWKDDKGLYVAKREENYGAGEYLVAFPPKFDYFQVLIPADDQVFEIKTTYPELNDNLTFKGSKDNEALREYFGYLKNVRTSSAPLGKERDSLQFAIDSTELSAKAKKNAGERIEAIKAEYAKIGDDVGEYQLNFVKKNKALYASDIIAAVINREIPENTTEDEQALYEYKYTKQHFFDHIDLTDNSLLRTSFLHSKITTYVERLTAQHPDSVITSLEYIFDKANYCSDIYQFYVNHYLNKYSKKDIIGFDQVYAHLGLRHYADSIITPWVADTIREAIVKDAEDMNKTLMGKIAPDFSFQTEDGSKHNMHEFDEKITVLYFWDADCSHCKKSYPKIVDYADSIKNDNIKFITICSKTYKEESKCWDFVNERNGQNLLNGFDPYMRSRYRQKYNLKSFPKLYILDKDKRIIMKDIGSERLAEIMDAVIKNMDEPYTGPSGTIQPFDHEKIYEQISSCKED